MRETATGSRLANGSGSASDGRDGKAGRREGTWAHLVRERRQALQLSQLELGRRAGLTQQAVSYIERGIGIPRVTTMVRVARSLGTTVEQLVLAPDQDRRAGEADEGGQPHGAP